jgi:segregation and condensation protein B
MLTEIEKIASIVESLLFVSDRPLTIDRMKEVLDVQDKELIVKAIELLQESYKVSLRGIGLQEVAGGYQLRTVPENANWILIMSQARPQRLSRAALESLAIVAYKQPLTRPEVESIRGVDCGGVLKTLLEKDLVRILGKKDEPGTPLIYGTTETFLSFFGIKNLRDLPSLKDYSDLQVAQ